MVNKAHKLLIEELEKYYPSISTKFKLELPGRTFEAFYKKGTRVLNYKQVQESCLFIYKGSAMELWVNSESLEETTIRFWVPKDFPYTTPGLFSQEPAPSYIKLLEDTYFVGIKFTDFLMLKNEFQEVEPLTENIRGHYDQMRNEYETDFRLPAIHRVQRLERQHPNIYTIAEIQHIAQYLKISVETLRRLRGR